MSVPKDLMKVLTCPKCKGSMEEKDMFIICSKCKLAYPVLDGNVPDMLMGDSWELGKAKEVKFKHELKL